MNARFLLLAVSVFGFSLQEVPKGSVNSERTTSGNLRKTKQALGDFNVLVGEWRGIGQPKRGSRNGTWIEKTQWVWDFSKPKQPALLMKPERSKLIQNLWLRFDEKSQQFVVDLQLLEQPKAIKRLVPAPSKDSGKKKAMSGSASKITTTAKSEPVLPPRIAFRQKDVAEGIDAYQVTLSVLKAKRVTILVEKGKVSFRRVAEIGYTRKGESLASRGSSGPECVVTGGAGTIKVSHAGKTYFVCCSGCQQAFNDDPEGVLADYRERLAEEKKKQKK
jgi:YHS domain-containing protein